MGAQREAQHSHDVRRATMRTQLAGHGPEKSGGPRLRGGSVCLAPACHRWREYEPAAGRDAPGVIFRAAVVQLEKCNSTTART